MDIMQKVVNIYNLIVDFILNILLECGVKADKIPDFLEKDLSVTAE